MQLTSWGTTRKTDLDMVHFIWTENSQWEKRAPRNPGNLMTTEFLNFLTRESELERRIMIFLVLPALVLFITLLWLSVDWFGLIGESPFANRISVWYSSKKTILVWLCNRRTKHKSINIECKPAHFRQPSLETWSRCSRLRSKPQPDSLSRLRNTQV